MTKEKLERLKELVGKLAQYRHCMSYDASYFTELPGMLKRTTRELEKLMDTLDPSSLEAGSVQESPLMLYAFHYDCHGGHSYFTAASSKEEAIEKIEKIVREENEKFKAEHKVEDGLHHFDPSDFRIEAHPLSGAAFEFTGD